MAQTPLRILDLPTVLSRIPFSKSHIARLEKSGDFPARVHIGRSRVGWVEKEVEEWLTDRIGARQDQRKETTHD